MILGIKFTQEHTNSVSSTILTSGLIVVLSYLIYANLLPNYFVVFFTAPFLPGRVVRIVLLELGAFTFIKYTLIQGTLPELLGCLLPSFLLQFYLWKHWQLFSLLLLFKLFCLYPLPNFPNAMFALISYSFVAYILEKDFRTYWKLMNKHKESNQIYRQLWMKVPYPVLIVSQKLQVVLSNISASATFADCSLDSIFTAENLTVAISFIKKVFEGKEKEEVIVKEKNSHWMIIVTPAEWKFERCAEISMIEIKEGKFNESLFKSFYKEQEECLNELSDGLFENFQSTEKLKADMFGKFYNFCVSFWSYELFLQQQAVYTLQVDEKPLDLAVEIFNAIEFFNVKESNKTIGYCFTNESSKVAILCNEIRIRLFLHVVIDFAKGIMENNTVIDFTLQNFDTNSTVCYTFTCSFSATGVDEELLILIFKKKKKNLEEFEEFSKKFGLSYALLYSNLKALNIEVKQIIYSKNIVTFSFFMRFPLSLLQPTSTRLNLSKKYYISNTKVLWNRVDNSFQGLLSMESQTAISIDKDQDSIGNFTQEERLSSIHNSYRETQKILKSAPNISQIPSSPGLIDAFLENKLRSSNSTNKIRKSKNNKFNSPDYSTTNRRPVKKFLYKECIKTLNYEIGTYRVLIVDDFEENRKVLQALIKKIMPVSCEFAKDGIGAAEMFENYASQGYIYQIIFMDLIMPRMNGYQASVRIRQKERENGYPKTFICAVSGNKDCSTKCYEAEIDFIGKNYLALKPLNISMLEAVIRYKNDLE